MLTVIFLFLQVELADTKARLEATKASMGKEIALLKEKLQKKADKVVNICFYLEVHVFWK